jgi:YVTN family beta-propeller protein
VAITPDGTSAYVTNENSNSVSVIDTTSNEVVATIAVGGQPRGVATTPDGTLIYVVNSFSNSVSVIDQSLNKVITAVVGVGQTPTNIVIGTVR